MVRRIAISSGHGLHIRGARGNPVPPQCDEVDEARKIVDKVASLLSCPKFHDNISYDQSTNLHTIVAWHDKQQRDLDVSVHLNATAGAHGTEVLYVSDGTKSLAKEVCDAICKAGGFTNRGPKKRTDLYFLNNTDEPAILLEMFFCDTTSDCDLYRKNFEAICSAIASSISGQPVKDDAPGKWPENPRDVPVEQRSTVARGDYGQDVTDLQKMLPRFIGEIDGDFGSVTEAEVLDYQRSRGLVADGVVGPNTWHALYDRKPPLPPPAAFTQAQQDEICRIAINSHIAEYAWKNRGRAPAGYTKGMALAFASTYRKLQHNHPAAIDMAKARVNSDKDALNLYKSKFDQLGMNNEHSGPDTLRHLYALMLGHGMRESSGRHCEGRDQSASNTSSDTAEAGLFQHSWNSHSASDPEFSDLMTEFSTGQSPSYLDQFAEDVSCSTSDWACYGSGNGYEFQDLCKTAPAFAVETCALTLRNLANHYGPIIRGETELREDSDEMFRDVQAYVDRLEGEV
jgi:peptidoglycan hydrolase-like protein with peptidoglycan-binding domain